MIEDFKTYNYENFGDFKIIKIDDKIYISATNIAKILGYTNPHKAIKDHCNIENKLKVNVQDRMGRSQKAIFIDNEGLLSLLTNCKTKTQDFRYKFILYLRNKNIIDDNILILTSRKEIEFVNMLEKILKPFNYKIHRQYQILKYKMDLYIEDLNIAIEYDENNHKDYDYNEQQKRQDEIEKELKCNFIRVADDKSDEWNCGYIIKEIERIKYKL